MSLVYRSSPKKKYKYIGEKKPEANDPLRRKKRGDRGRAL